MSRGSSLQHVHKVAVCRQIDRNTPLLGDVLAYVDAGK